MASGTAVPIHSQKPSTRDDDEFFSCTTAVPSTESHSQDGITDAYWTIWISCAFIAIPMVVLSCLLLGLVFNNQVLESDTVSGSLQLPMNHISFSGAYLVNYSATRLITVASWTSSVAPLLPTFVMILLSYPAASKIREASVQNSPSSLPTAFQLGLYLRNLNGSIESLWDWYRHNLGRKGARSGSAMTVPAVGLTLVTFLGYMILVTDTWLHVATSTIPYSRTTPSVTHSFYGRDLGSWYQYYNTYTENNTRFDFSEITCNMGSTIPVLSVADEAYLVLNNLSSVHQVSTFEKEGQLYALLTNTSLPLDLDFQASSFATATKCGLSNHDCSLNFTMGGVDTKLTFSCSPEFRGDLTNLSFIGCSDAGPSAVGLRFYEGTNLTKSLFNCAQGIFTPPQGNSLYFGTWATVQYTTPDNPEYSYDPDDLSKVNDIVHPGTSKDSWILTCNTTTYRANYTWINGAVSAATVQADEALGLIVGTQWSDPCAQPDLENIVRTMSHCKDRKGLADQWALGFSKTTMARLAHLTTSTATIAQQNREKFLVARIPKVPLFGLVILNLVYAQIAIWLACYACLLTHPSMTRNVQARLTIAGLAAACFEKDSDNAKAITKIENLYSEKRNPDAAQATVGIIKSEGGGWEYTLFEPDPNVEDSANTNDEERLMPEPSIISKESDEMPSRPVSQLTEAETCVEVVSAVRLPLLRRCPTV